MSLRWRRSNRRKKKGEWDDLGVPGLECGCEGPIRSDSPASIGACWRRHTVLSGRKCLCSLSLGRRHCASDRATSVALAAGGGEAVKARSGRHRRRNMAS